MTDVKVRMDRGGTYSTVHGERAPDDKHAATHFVQDGLPFDAEGHLIIDHADFEAERGDQCSRRAAELRGKAHALIAAAQRKAKKKAEERRRLAEQDEPRQGARRTLPRADTVRAPVPPPPAPATRIAAPPPAAPAEAPSAVLQVGGDQPPQQGEEAEDETDVDAENLDTDDQDADDGDDADADTTDDTEPNVEAYLRGEEEIQWHILTQLLARRYARRFSNLEDALEFLVEAQDGPHVVPFAQLKPAFQKKLK